MENLLVSFLFQKGYCPLPGVGSLQMAFEPAEAFHAGGTIQAPQPVILLSPTAPAEKELVDFLARKAAVSEAKAGEMLQHYSEGLLELPPDERRELTGAGSFVVNANGALGFIHRGLPTSFFPELILERVEQVADIHSVRVGDTETTNEVMADFLSKKGEKQRQTWWIFSLLLLLAVVVLVIVYLNNTKPTQNWGTRQPISRPAAEATYRSGP